MTAVESLLAIFFLPCAYPLPILGDILHWIRGHDVIGRDRQRQFLKTKASYGGVRSKKKAKRKKLSKFSKKKKLKNIGNVSDADVPFLDEIYGPVIEGKTVPDIVPLPIQRSRLFGLQGLTFEDPQKLPMNFGPFGFYENFKY